MQSFSTPVMFQSVSQQCVGRGRRLTATIKNSVSAQLTDLETMNHSSSLDSCSSSGPPGGLGAGGSCAGPQSFPTLHSRERGIQWSSCSGVVLQWAQSRFFLLMMLWLRTDTSVTSSFLSTLSTTIQLVHLCLVCQSGSGRPTGS